MRSSQSLDRRGSFSDLLGVLSTRFARISHDEVGAELSDWLGRICQSLGFDRSVFVENLPDKGGFYTIESWNREGFPRVQSMAEAAADFPWVSRNAMTGEIVTVTNVATLPKEAARDRNYMLKVGMKAMAGVPLVIGNRLVAGITFEDFHQERKWTPSLLTKLKLVGDIFANALERQHTATEAGRLRDEAQSIGRLALMGEMAAAIAHELSHPLGAILANAQAARRLLESAHPNLSQLKEALDDVITGERRAAAYVAEVRTLFRRSDLHTESLQVDALFDAVASLMRSDLLARGVFLEMQIEPALPMITADRVGIEQVMINLIQNAADAVDAIESANRRVTVRAFRRDPQSIGIAVDDTGQGIDEKQLGKIFQPLFTTKSKGTGMGLTIVRSILESHGTYVRVHSERGTGTTFEFTLRVAGES